MHMSMAIPQDQQDAFVFATMGLAAPFEVEAGLLRAETTALRTEAAVDASVTPGVAAAAEARGGVVESYDSFAAFKAANGPAGEDMQWHHIVEQSQVGRSGFTVSRVNSVDNIVGLPEDVHGQISAYYSSRPRGFSTTVRNTLNGMSFEDQYQFGIDVIRRAFAGELW